MAFKKKDREKKGKGDKSLDSVGALSVASCVMAAPTHTPPRYDTGGRGGRDSTGG